MLRPGSRHDVYVNPKTGQKQTVPRHAEIDNALAGHIGSTSDWNSPNQRIERYGAFRTKVHALRSPFALLRENAGLSWCPFPSLRSGKTRGTKLTASRRFSPALGLGSHYRI